MICQMNYFISTSSPKLKIVSAACAVCVFEDTLWILLRIQSKEPYCGCISPSLAIHVLNVLPVGEHFYYTFLSSIPCAVFLLMLFLLLGLQTALTSEIATSSKVIRMLPELLRARVMTWPWLSDGWAGDTGTQTVLVCLKYSVSSFQALGSPLSQSPNTQNRPLKQDSSILENLALSTGSLD